MYLGYHKDSLARNTLRLNTPVTPCITTDYSEYPFQYSFRHTSIPIDSSDIICIGYPKNQLYIEDISMQYWAFRHPVSMNYNFDNYVRQENLQIHPLATALDNDFPLVTKDYFSTGDLLMFHDEFSKDEVLNGLKDDYQRRMNDYTNKMSYESVDTRIKIDHIKAKQETEAKLSLMMQEDIIEKSTEKDPDTDQETSDTEYLIPSGRWYYSCPT